MAERVDPTPRKDFTDTDPPGAIVPNGQVTIKPVDDPEPVAFDSPPERASEIKTEDEAIPKVSGGGFTAKPAKVPPTNATPTLELLLYDREVCPSPSSLDSLKTSESLALSAGAEARLEILSKDINPVAVAI